MGCKKQGAKKRVIVAQKEKRQTGFNSNFLRNLHGRFVLCSNGQIYGGDFAKFCGLLRIYELYCQR